MAGQVAGTPLHQPVEPGQQLPRTPSARPGALARLARRANLVVSAFRAMGLKRTALRVRYEVAHRSGWLAHRYPAGNLARWMPDPAVLERLRREMDEGLFWTSDRADFQSAYRRLFPDIGPELQGEADRLVAGEMKYFSRQWALFDPRRDWFRNPFTTQAVDGRDHWTHVPWDAPESGDLKFQLEPARFAWVYALTRAYRYSGDERYTQAFWRLFDGWCEQNPPQAGPLWICGQESSLRLMAMTFGLFAFAPSAETSSDRLARLVGMIAAHADRALGTTVYARSQQNNHALSEGAGLLTAGLLLAGYADAERWQQAGRTILEEQVPLQIYQDGGYTQHSHNYHRVMLNILTWAVLFSRRRGKPLSQRIEARLAAAAEFLRNMLDPTTGRVPNYGHNDGALILPLSICPYDDFRPAVQAAALAGSGTVPLSAGVWDEDVFWLAGPTAIESARDKAHTIPKPSGQTHCSVFATAGYDVLRGKETWSMVRAAHYRDRPGQADQLHLDIWWRGINVACDAGTYLYNGSPPWQNALAVTGVHNTVTVDNQDQMTRAGRFLWIDWAQATRAPAIESKGGQLAYWRGSHEGYRRIDPALVHVREVLRLGDAHWLVFDSLSGSVTHAFRLHWMLPEMPHRFDPMTRRLELDTTAGAYEVRVGAVSGEGESTIVVGDPNSIRGWRSRYYGDREPAISLALQAAAKSSRFWTLLGPAGVEIAFDERGVRLNGTDWTAEIEIAPSLDKPGIRKIGWSGAVADSLLTPAP